LTRTKKTKKLGLSEDARGRRDVEKSASVKTKDLTKKTLN
jgi:hypothetical protein